MLEALAETLGLNKNRARMRRWRAAAARIGALEPALAALDDEGLRARVNELKAKCAREPEPARGKRDPLLEECFALGREASKRRLGMRHFDVQLIGALALHEGMLAEMKTGEGKSLCLTLAASYNAIRGTQAHVVTVNEYLARRDAAAMAPLYDFFGLRVGLLENSQSLLERREQYGSDVVYGVNHEFGFDYLRHNMAREDAERRLVRGLGFAIVDEVDSILIDEARTPLIITSAENDDLAIYQHSWTAAQALVDKDDLTVDEKQRTVLLTESGFEKVEKLFEEWGLIERGHHLYESRNNAMIRAIQACLSARFLFHKDVNYIVSEGKVLIVDENTGRLMSDRRWSNGIHQAVETKEGVERLQESRTIATITYQNFFRLYGKLSGLTGTAMTQASEFWNIYGLEAVPIPTHMPMIRKDQPDVIYRSEREKYEALALEAQEGVKQGRPVLAGTSNIEESEKLSRALAKIGVKHLLLNAKNHEREAQIVEEAGLAGRVTVATNMAGRGTDIALGGSWSSIEARMRQEGASLGSMAQEKMEWEARRDAILAAGGLLVLGCARNESRRVDNQLRGRSGRQGDPGESKFFISLDDALFRIYAQNGVLAMIDKHNMMPEGSSLQHPMLNKSLDKAQAAVENHHYEMRRQLQEYDGVGAAQRKMVYGWRDDIIDATDDEVWTMASRMVEQALEDASEDIVRSQNVEMFEQPEAREMIEALGPIPEEFSAWIAEEGEPDGVKDKLGAAWELRVQAAKSLGLGRDGANTLRALMLDRIDEAWQEHLTILQNLMDGIHLRSYAQKDPKQEYKREGYAMFGRLRAGIVGQSAAAILAWTATAGLPVLEDQEAELALGADNSPRWLAGDGGAEHEEIIPREEIVDSAGHAEAENTGKA